MRSKFDEQLELLHKELITMGALCEKAIALSAKAAAEGDPLLCGPVPSLAEQIDQKEREIEAMCLKLLLQQQPVATDLRDISSALKIITDMERIGHQSADIAEIVELAHIKATEDSRDVHAMAVAVIKMVTDSIDAFVKKDAGLAQAVIDYDDVVDSLFDMIKQQLAAQLGGPGADGEYAVDLLMIAKYLERIGDHAVNIAKWVLFSINGARE